MLTAGWRKAAARLDEFIDHSGGLRLVLGLLAGVAAGCLIGGALVLLGPVIDNQPAGLFIFPAYIRDIPIDNRILAAKAALIVSLVVFLVVSFSRRSKIAAERLDLKFRPIREKTLDDFGPRLKLAAGRLAEAIVNVGRPPANLAEHRRAQAKWLGPGLLFSASAVTALMVGVEKIYPLLWPAAAPTALPPLLGTLRWANLLVVPLPLLMWLRFPQRGLPRLTLVSQLALLPFFLLLIPEPVPVDGQAVYMLPPGRIAAVSLALILWGAADIWIRGKRAWGRGVFSRTALFALLLGACLPHVDPGVQHFGLMYELGNRVSQMWMLINGEGGGLFKDYYMTYGLYDVLGILLGWLFYGPTLVAADAGMYTLSLVVLAAGLFAAALRILPLAAAWALVYLLNAPQTWSASHFFNVAPASIVFIYVSFLLHPHLTRQPGRWLVVWGLWSAFLPFFRIPQGAVAVLATLPAAGLQVIALWRGPRGQVLKVGIFFTVLALMVMVWPFGPHFRGLIRMFLETGSINSPWVASISITVRSLGGFFYRPWDILVVCAYGLLPMLAFASALYMRQNRAVPTAGAVGWSLFVFVVIYTASTISYSFACAYYWRSYQVSVTLAVVAGLAVGLFCPGRVAKYLILTVLFFIVACYVRLTPEFSTFRLESSSFVTASLRAAQGLPPDPSQPEIVDGADYGLPRFGRGQFIFKMRDQAEYVARMALAGDLLDRALDPEETFLNLASDGNDYFLLDRELPTEYPFPYLYPGDEAQKRAVRDLERRRITTSIWYPDITKGTEPSDNPFSERTYYLYRYALTQGLPLQAAPTLFLILPEDRFERLGLTPPDKSETLRLYDQMYKSGRIAHLRYLPMTWGRGFESFKKKGLIQKTRDLPGGSVKPKADGWEHSFEKPVRGLDNGLLVLDLDTADGLDLFEVTWVLEELPEETNHMIFLVGNGLNIVPLDINPRWLLAEGVKSVKVRSVQEKSFSVKQAWLYARQL